LKVLLSKPFLGSLMDQRNHRPKSDGSGPHQQRYSGKHLLHDLKDFSKKRKNPKKEPNISKRDGPGRKKDSLIVYGHVF